MSKYIVNRSSLKPKKNMLKPLPLSFYLRDDVLAISRDLLGKVLVTNLEGIRTTGRIVETEAYAGEIDRASHASKGRTPRTDVMFGQGGRAYVYLCYGIHQMFNIVTSGEGKPHAILVRGVEPMEGIEDMLIRTGKSKPDASLARGPGNVGKAFGFHTSQCGLSLQGPELFIADDGYVLSDDQIGKSPRIGVDYAGEHAAWDYRFYIKGHPSVSGKIK
jgi:DNA-3-methyladenine glycosylase